jgi:nitrate/nitrite-specific signal transduction histidine kinase
MSDERTSIFARGEEFLKLFTKGAELTKALMQENERLRRRLVNVESTQRHAAQDPDDWEKLRQELLVRIADLEVQHESMMERLQEVEAENRQFADRYLEVEEENNALANLYVASFQLHSTLDLVEVFKIIIEIVINLIGAEVFAVYVLDEKSNRLEAVASEGRDVRDFPQIPLGSGMVGSSVASGNTVCSETGRSDDLSAPIACIPLRVQEQSIGAIAIYSLLQQKDEFTPLDHELFTLLAGHAATAIFSCRLYAQSERKLNTIQGFIDLLTK